MAIICHDQSKARKPHEQAARLGVVMDALRDEVVVAREHPEMGFQITRCPFGDGFDRLTVDEIVVTSLHTGAFTNLVSAEVVPSDLGDDAVTEKLAEIIQRDPAWILSRSPEEVACNWARNNTGQIVLTETQSRAIQEAMTDLSGFIAAAEIIKAPSFRIRFETPMHALLRFCTTEYAPLAQKSDAAAVAFLFITKAGYGVGLWSRRTGLVHETEQGLAPDLTTQEIGAQIIDLLSGLLSPSSLKDFGLGPVTLLVIALAPDLPDGLIGEIGDHFSSLEVMPLLPAEPCYGLMEMLATGLLCPAEQLPQLDLSDDLRPRAERIIARRQAETATRRTQRKRKVVLALMTPFLVLLGAMLGSYLYISRQVARTAELQAKEEQERARLQAADSLRHSAEENFKWYVSTINQILELKQKQPSTVGLLLDLDRRWPTSDPTWHLTALRTSPQGAIEIRGTTSNHEAITQFVSAVEFGGNFSGIQPEVKTSLLSAGDSAAPNLASKSALEFSVKAIYAPLAGSSVPARTPMAPATNSIVPSRSMMPSPGTAPGAPALTPSSKSNAPVSPSPGQIASPPTPISGENSVRVQNQGGLR